LSCSGYLAGLTGNTWVQNSSYDHTNLEDTESDPVSLSGGSTVVYSHSIIYDHARLLDSRCLWAARQSFYTNVVYDMSLGMNEIFCDSQRLDGLFLRLWQMRWARRLMRCQSYLSGKISLLGHDGICYEHAGLRDLLWLSMVRRFLIWGYDRWNEHMRLRDIDCIWAARRKFHTDIRPDISTRNYEIPCSLQRRCCLFCEIRADDMSIQAYEISDGSRRCDGVIPWSWPVVWRWWCQDMVRKGYLSHWIPAMLYNFEASDITTVVWGIIEAESVYLIGLIDLL